MNLKIISLSFLVFLGAGCQNFIQPQPATQDAASPTSTAVSSVPSNPLRFSVPNLGFSYELSDWDMKNMPPGKIFGNQLIFGNESKKWMVGFIERIPRKQGENFLDAVQAFLQQHGYDKGSCKIEPINPADAGGWFFTGPTMPLNQPQGMSSLGVRGNILTEKFAITHCGPYAVRRSYFITNEKQPNAPILYVNLGEDGNGVLYGGPIQFLP